MYVDAQEKVNDIGFLSNIIENHDEPRGVSRYIPEGDCCAESKYDSFLIFRIPAQGNQFFVKASHGIRVIYLRFGIDF